MEPRRSTENGSDVELAKLRSENDWLRNQLAAYQELANDMLRKFRTIERGLVAREDARLANVGKRVIG